MKRVVFALLSLALMALASCATKAKFILPPDSTLYINGEAVQPREDGTVVTKPYFWSFTGGIPYVLKRDGQIIRQDKCQAGFRVVSIFWPPFAIIYWPMGFGRDTYDLTDGGGAVQ